MMSGPDFPFFLFLVGSSRITYALYSDLFHICFENIRFCFLYAENWIHHLHWIKSPSHGSLDIRLIPIYLKELVFLSSNIQSFLQREQEYLDINLIFIS